MEKRYATRAFTLLIFYCLLCSLPASVSAHAFVVASSPVENEVLEEAPASVSITFNEPIENAFHSLQVTGPSGRQATEGVARIDDANSAKLIADLRTELPDGIYTVNYKVLSSDGHTVTGTFPFIIGDAAAGQSPPASNEPDSSQGSNWPGLGLLLVRWFQYSGLAMYIGVLVFHLLLLPRRTAVDTAAARMDAKAALEDISQGNIKGNGWTNKHQTARQQNHLESFAQFPVWQRSKRLLILSLILAAAGIVLSLPQQTSSDARVPWYQAWSPAWIKDTLSLTSFGKAWIAEIVLLLLLAGLTVALVVLARKRKPLAADWASAADWSSAQNWTASVALIASFGILLAKSFIGHSAAASERSIAIAMNFLHQTSSFLWLGGLLSLAFLLPHAAKSRRGEPGSKSRIYWETIRRFSILAAGCVAILLCSGFYAGLLHVPTWHALLHSNYGLILLAKGGLTLVMLALGLSAFLRGRKQTQPLGRGVWVEFITGLIVLVLAAVLSNMPTSLASPGPVQLKAVTADGYHITLKVSPNIVGENRFEVIALDREQKPLNGIEQITLTLTSLDMDMGTIELAIPKGGDSIPLSGNTIVTMGGSWKLNVHILLSSLETIDSSFTFQVGNK
ncbi:copper resistance CopC/CopD family protein [Paenibacillus fonticola]|uniref:copper resistance CopC/CopD family protein n=1 Tax=Paenibacillus fonticola TaxID=379896 RepID=UPI0003769CCE|nr:copper resistance protein CopC [Paenibacillus fonticola]